MLHTNAVAQQLLAMRQFHGVTSDDELDQLELAQRFVVNISAMSKKSFPPFTITAVGDGLFLLEDQDPHKSY